MCRLGVRNVQCVGVHEIPLKAGWTRWPCNLIKQKTRSQWGSFISFLLERSFFFSSFSNMTCGLIGRNWTLDVSRFVLGSSPTRSAFQVYHQRVVRPDQRRIFIPPGSISQVSLLLSFLFIWKINSFLFSCPLFYSLKLECEKLASEKIEIQRHYVMVNWFSLVNYSFCMSFNCLTFFVYQYYEMSYGLNVEMHKQVEMKIFFLLWLFGSLSFFLF